MSDVVWALVRMSVGYLARMLFWEEVRMSVCGGGGVLQMNGVVLKEVKMSVGVFLMNGVALGEVRMSFVVF